MFRYKVLKRCFVAGVLRDPDGRHDPYETNVALDPVPHYLKLIDGELPKKRRRTRADAAPKPDPVQGKVPGEKVKWADE